MCRCCSRRKTNKKAVITEKRIENLVNAYDDILWDRGSVEITIEGFGDIPAWKINGVLTDSKENLIDVTWFSATPGGGNSRLHYWKNGLIFKIRQAPLYRAPEITKSIVLS